MENWKRALIAGGATLGIVMFAKRKKTAGMICAGVSLATLASEYPEEFAHIRKNLHEYVEQGATFLELASRVGERMAEAAEGRGSAWLESLLAG
jgi:hypothetical protein